MSDAGAPGIRDILRIPEIRAAVIGTFVIMLGFGILFPILPLYARSFGVGYAEVGLAASAFAITRLVFDLVAGPIVDRLGERRAATVGAMVVGATTALAALAPDFASFVVFRGAGGAGSSVFFAALLSYILRVVPKERMGRVMAVYYGAFNLGFIVGPPLGGVLAHRFGLSSPLWVYAASCFAAAWLYHRWIRDGGERSREVRRVGFRGLRWDRSFATVLISNLAYGAVLSGMSTLIPLFGTERVGVTEVGVSLAFALWSLTELIVMYPVGATSDRRGRKRVMVPSLAATAAVVALFGFATPVWAFMLANGVLGLFTGAAGVPPAAMLSDLVGEEASGSAAGVFRFMGDLGFVIGPLSAGASAERMGFGPAFALASIPCAVALLLVLWVPDTLATARRRRREQQGL